MPSALNQVRAARLPAGSASRLGDLRRTPGVAITPRSDFTWIRWPEGDAELARRVLAIPGAVLYVHREGRWRRQGDSLPDFDAPFHDDGRGEIPLSRAIAPEAVHPSGAEDGPVRPARLTLARDGRPRRAAAWLGPIESLATWAERAPSSAFHGLRAARSQAIALVVASGSARLPVVERGERYWGSRLLCPLGLSVVPSLGEAALLRMLKAGAEELAIVSSQGVETLPLERLQPVTRASVRRAAAEWRAES